MKRETVLSTNGGGGGELAPVVGEDAGKIRQSQTY